VNARRRGPANDLAVEADHMSLLLHRRVRGPRSIDDVGKAATLFREPVASEADLVRQIGWPDRSAWPSG
jgi:hypothetical protein